MYPLKLTAYGQTIAYTAASMCMVECHQESINYG
jgi:hypothetical protein